MTTGGRLINYANTTQSYFGDSTVANPPQGFVRTPGTGGFVPSNAASGRTADLDTTSDFGRGVSGQVDGVSQSRGTQSPLVGLFEGGAFDVNTARDATVVEPQPGQVERVLNSPEALVLGNRLTAGRMNDSLADAGGRTLSPYTRLGRDGRLESLTSDRLRLLGGELLRDEQGQLLADGEVDRAFAGGQAVDATATDAVADQTGDAALDRIDQGLRPDDAVLRLADPAEQSAQYAQLQRRLDRFKADPLGDRIRRVRQPAEAQDAPNNLPGLPNLPGMPDLGEPDVEPSDGDSAPVGRRNGVEAVQPEVAESVDPPVVVERFSAGVASPTLKAVLQDAETQLADGQFATAAARFEAAARLLPNQPLVVARSRQRRTGRRLLSSGFRNASPGVRASPGIGDGPGEHHGHHRPGACG